MFDYDLKVPIAQVSTQIRGTALLADTETPWGLQKRRALLTPIYDVRSLIVHNGQQLADKNLSKNS